MQPESITRRFPALVAALALLAAPAVRPADAWREAPQYLAIVAPAAHRADYQVSVSPLGLDAVLQSLAADPSLVRTPGAWQARDQYAPDAFGRTGAYNRWQLARLYGSRQARVARGSRIDDGRIVEAWTLISPYPSPDRSRLEPGTLRIVLRIAP